jgi:toxin ParE1/3/4
VFVYLPLSRDDMEEIGLYIANDNVDTALRFVSFIEEKCQRIADTPNIGRARYNLAPSLRSFPVDGYLVLYKPLDDGIAVVRVVHSSRDIPHLF